MNLIVERWNYKIGENFLKPPKELPFGIRWNRIITEERKNQPESRCVLSVKSNQAGKTIYLCKGKKELKRRSFGKVIGEAVELLKYADYVYIFGSTESFEVFAYLAAEGG